jgi:acyl carrier protein
MQAQQAVTIDDILKCLEESSLMIPGRLEPGTPLKALGGWDSIGMVTFITLVKKRTGIRFRISDLIHCDTPESFLKLIHERTGSRPETA